MTDSELEALEAKIYELQAEIIKAKYGSEIAAMANYGWAVDTNPDMVGVATKVYLHNERPVLLHSESTATGIEHEWGKY
jgi:hypothetical protein